MEQKYFYLDFIYVIINHRWNGSFVSFPSEHLLLQGKVFTAEKSSWSSSGKHSPTSVIGISITCHILIYNQCYYKAIVQHITQITALSHALLHLLVSPWGLWRFRGLAQGPISLTIFHLQFDFYKKRLFYCNSVPDHQIATDFCTCHDTTAVMPCAIFCSNH